MIDRIVLQLRISDDDAETLALSLGQFQKVATSPADKEFCEDLSCLLYSLLQVADSSSESGFDITMRYTSPEVLRSYDGFPSYDDSLDTFESL